MVLKTHYGALTIAQGMTCTVMPLQNQMRFKPCQIDAVVMRFFFASL